MGLAEAAQKCGISVSTLRRRKDVLVAAGATVSDKGWKIPIPVLVSLGFLAGTTPPPATRHDTAAQPATVSPADGPHAAALVELDSLRARLADAERRAAVAEAIAGERERVIQVQATALRMLERGTPDAPASAAPDGPSDSPMDTPVVSPVAAPQGRLHRLLSFGARRS